MSAEKPISREAAAQEPRAAHGLGTRPELEAAGAAYVALASAAMTKDCTRTLISWSIPRLGVCLMKIFAAQLAPLLSALIVTWLAISPSLAIASIPMAIWQQPYEAIDEMQGGAGERLTLLVDRTQNGDIGEATGVELPFGFRLLGSETYLKFNVGAKGYISFGVGADFSASRGEADYLVREPAPKSVIAAWWGDHACEKVGSVKTKTLGAAPNRQFVIEWSDCWEKGPQGARTDHTFQAQIWLREGSDAFRVKYGTATAAPLVAPRRLNLSWGVKPRSGAGSFGLARDGGPAGCVPNSTVGSNPRPCSVQHDFPYESVIQYGLLDQPDVSGRVQQQIVSRSPTQIGLDATLSILNLSSLQIGGLGYELYLESRYAEPEQSRIKIVEGPPSESLGAGETKLIRRELRIERPPNGDYRLCALLDPEDRIGDIDRSNNWICSTERFLLGPDLTGTITAPVAAGAGETVSVPISFENVGEGPAGPFDYRIRLRDNEGGTSLSDLFIDRFEGTLQPPGGAGPNEERLVVEVQLPQVMKFRAYVFELEIDLGREVDDFNRANNRVRSSGSMHHFMPELRIDSQGSRVHFPDGCYYGEPVEAVVKICNHGVADARHFFPALVMSHGSQINFNDDVPAASSPAFCGDLGGANHNPCTAAGAICSFQYCRTECTEDEDCGATTKGCWSDPLLSQTLGREAKSCQNILRFGTAPSEEKCETYFMEGRIPTENRWGEAYEAEDLSFYLIDDAQQGLSQARSSVLSVGSMECRPPLLDLAPVELVPQSPLVAGKIAKIHRRIENLGFINQPPDGSQRPERQAFTYQYFLAPGPAVSREQIPVALESTGGAGWASITRRGIEERVDRVQIPEHILPGSYYLGLLLDPDDEHVELNKENNLFVFPDPIQVEAAGLRVATSSLPRATVGRAFSQGLRAAGGAAPYRWEGEHLPPGIELSEDGRLHGVAALEGRFAFTAKVRSGSSTSERMLALEVLPGQSPLEISTEILPTAVRGASYGGWFNPDTGRREEGVRLAAVGGLPPYRWSLVAGAEGGRPPEGIAPPTEDGWLRGQATLMAQSAPFLVEVRDQLGNRAERALEIHVVEGDALRISSGLFPLAFTGEPYLGGCIEAAGGGGSFSWEVDPTTLPPGLEHWAEGSTLCLEGAPLRCGFFRVGLQVADGRGQKIATQIPLSVECGALQLRSDEVRPVEVGEEIAFQLRALPSEQPRFLLYRGSLPAGLSLREDGLIQGVVSGDQPAERYDAILELSDPLGRRSLSALTMRVEPPLSDGGPAVAKRDGSSCSSGGGGVSLGALALGLLGMIAWPRRPSLGKPAASGRGAASPLGRRSAPLQRLSPWRFFAGCRLRGSEPPAGLRLRYRPAAPLFGLMGLLGLGCGWEGKTPAVKELCAEVQCDAGMVCDEADGICRCGGSLVCSADEYCKLDPTPSCLTEHCLGGQACTKGQSCDPQTGMCLCGSSSCAEDEHCEEGVCVVEGRCDAASCPDGMSCDPEDGRCKCEGIVCDEGEICVEGSCSYDPCAGVSCGSNSVCNPEDGRCRCGGPDGQFCSTGEACIELEPTQPPRCAISTKCDGVDCRGGTVCDPEDGSCRCGGIGTLYPHCEEGAGCIDGACRGSLLCEPGGVPTLCEPGLHCDPYDGLCKCGGVDGTLCAESEGCFYLAAGPSCLPTCTLLEVPSSCGPGHGCYFEPGSGPESGYCAPMGDGFLGERCSEQSDCSQHLHCNALGRCARLCNAEESPELCLSIGQHYHCASFSFGDPFGYCRPP